MIPREVIKSAYVHKTIAKEMQKWDYEGKSPLEIVRRVESEIRSALPEDDWLPSAMDMSLQLSDPLRGSKRVELNQGIAFPVGIGINHCVAHYGPLLSEESETLIEKGDLLKIDFGVHVGGHITDSAFTVGVNTTRFDELIEVSKRATMIGVKMSGPDQLLSEIGEAIEEYVMNKEITITDSHQRYPLKTMKELCGHSIAPFIIHSGKAVPNCNLGKLSPPIEYRERMKSNEKYAIEPFITTGNGVNIYGTEVSHYMINPKSISSPSPSPSSRFYEYIRNEYQTLPFNLRWLEELAPSLLGCQSHQEIRSCLKEWVDAKMIEEYPPIYDVEGSYVAQTEHNVWIGEKRAYLLTG